MKYGLDSIVGKNFYIELGKFVTCFLERLQCFAVRNFVNPNNQLEFVRACKFLENVILQQKLYAIAGCECKHSTSTRCALTKFENLFVQERRFWIRWVLNVKLHVQN